MSVKHKDSKGQALVLVLLSLAVVLTLVLFILSRSITDIAVSSKNEESVRAFSAAEAGVEQSLVIGTGASSTTIGNASYASSVTSFAEAVKEFAYPIELSSGDTMTIWFVSHDPKSVPECTDNKCFTGNTLKVCWGKVGTLSSASVTPAIEISVFYESTPGSLPTIKIARAAFDSFVGRVPANSFSVPDGGTCTVDGVNYQFQKTILFSDLGIPPGSYNVQNGLQFARVRMLYNTDTSHGVGISVNFAGNSALASQGQDISATGTAGQSNRKISVFQGWPEASSIFDGAIYSSTGLVK